MTKINKTTFKQAVDKSNGTRSSIARVLDVTNSAITNFLHKNPESDELLQKQRLTNIDRAEEEIFSQMDFHDSDDPIPAARVRNKASEFILKNLGKDRGWVEKQQIEHSGEIDTKIDVIIPKEVKELLK